MKVVTKRIPSKKAVHLQFDIYSGFKNIDQLEANMIGLGFYEQEYVAVKFNNQFYGVVSINSDTAIVVGFEMTWLKEFGLWRRESTIALSPMTSPNKLMKGKKANMEIIKDLLELDPNFEVLNGYKTGWKNIRGEYQYALYMAELLGRTFYATYLKEEDFHILSMYEYLETESFEKYLQGRRVVGINPFRTEALFLSGKVHKILL